MVDTQLYFSYGSNLDQAQMKQRCPSAVVFSVGHIKNYQIAFTKYSDTRSGGVADIIPKAKSQVWGVVWRLTQADLIQLDYIEGYPDFYTRNRIAVELVNGMALQAWAYEVVDKETFVQPSNDYLELIVNGAEAFELPAEYINKIKNSAKGVVH